MTEPSKTRTALLLTLLLGAACASAPARMPESSPMASKPQAASSSSAAATATAPATALDLKVAPNLGPMKIDAGKLALSSDRVALIWGYAACPARPWAVTVVDLGSRAIILRTLAATSELPIYRPPVPGEACYKGPCPTITVEMTPPSSISGPSLYSGTGTMMGGTGKGIYASTSGTACTEPPMLADGDLVDLAMRLVQGRNDAAAAVAARAPAR